MAIPSDAKYSGTKGTCNWYITQSGDLVIEPQSGSSGVIYPVFLAGYPWSESPLVDPSNISKSVLTATVKPGVTYANSGRLGSSDNLFSNCINLKRVSAPAAFWNSLDSCSSMFHRCKSLEHIFFNNASFSKSEVMSFMFWGCSSLTSLDLQSFNTSKVTEADYMFTGCDLLTTVILGSNWKVPDRYLDLAPCMNASTGIYCRNNSDYSNLTDSEKRGTWQRFVSQRFDVTAYRSENGSEDEDGSDATLKISYAISGSETSSTLTVYKKTASESSYPSTPVETRTLSGSSGNVTVTILNIGDSAYDFRVEWSYGSVTCVTFPSIATNIHLVDIDPDGNVTVYGNLDAANIRCGVIAGENVSGNSFKNYDVTFKPAFPGAEPPIVVVGFMSSSTSPDIGYMAVSALNITTTGFTARVYNRGSTRAPYIHWIATTSGKQQ